MTLTLSAPLYEEHLTPNGYLPREKKEAASAAWHFSKLAHVALERIPEQVTYEGDTDRTVRLTRLAHSVRILYGFESLQDFLPFLDFVRSEAARVGLPWNDRLEAWRASGGRAYDEMTREPGALNKE